MEVTKNKKKGIEVIPLKPLSPEDLNFQVKAGMIAIKCPLISKHHMLGNSEMISSDKEIAEQFQEAYRVPHLVYSIHKETSKLTGVEVGDYIYARPELFALRTTGAGAIMKFVQQGFKPIKLIVFDAHFLLGIAINKKPFETLHSAPLMIETLHHDLTT